MRVRRLGQEGLDRHHPGGRRHRQEGDRGRLPGRALRRGTGAVVARGDRAGVRLVCRHRRATRRRRGRTPGSTPHPARPACPAADRPGPSACGGAGGRGPGTRLAAQRRGPAPPRRRSDGISQAGVRVRPSVHVLRDPVVSRLVRLAAPGGRAGRGRVAGLDRRPRTGTGQRELDVLRQGPQRPARAGEATARSRSGRRRRTRPGLLPATGRTASVLARRDRLDPRSRAVLRPVLPARQPCGAAADEAVRLDRLVPRHPGSGPQARAGCGRAQQRDRRVPGRDRGRRRRVGAVPHAGPARRDRGVRLLRRGRHRGGRFRRQTRRRRDRGARRADHDARRRTRGPARRGPRGHARRGPRRGGRRRRGRRPGGTPGARGRRLDPDWSAPTACAAARSSPRSSSSPRASIWWPSPAVPCR